MLTLTGRNVVRRALGQWLSSSMARPKENWEPSQEAALKENCFLVDEKDNVVGVASKKECHLVKPDGTIPLHRAFSVFLFNTKGELLLQRRSAEKITFPDSYTNSCCSHPIADVPGEEEEKDALGIKRAAQRRLNYELGIPVESMELDKFKYLTRIHYRDAGDGKWGEHEIDYILFLQDDLKLKPNPKEISEANFVSRKGLDPFLACLKVPLTPWFSLILKHQLPTWWENLDNLDKFKQHDKIWYLDATSCNEIITCH